MFKNIKKAFTLTEVLIASAISTIVLGFIFIFLANMVEWIGHTKKEVAIFSAFYDFTNKLNNYRNVYVSWSILTETLSWSDVFLMRDASWQDGMLFWPVNLSDNKIDITNSTTIYKNTWIWFRRVSALELAEIDLDTNEIFDYIFQNDQIYPDLKVKNLVLKSYNSWTIINMDLLLNINFNNWLVWTSWSEIPKDYLRNFNIDF